MRVVRRRWTVATVLLALSGSLGLYAGQESQEAPEGQLIQIDASAAKQSNLPRTYIVRMAEEPVATYDGSKPGYRATRPARGQKINPLDSAVITYASYLVGSHDAVLARVGGRKLYDYSYVINGFAAVLTPDQAAMLGQEPGVASVEEDVAAPLDTVTTPEFLGLTTPLVGLWDQVGGKDRAGEDIIIGMVDGGVWPEHPSFSDRTGSNKNGHGDKLSYHQIPHWNGKCTPGEAFNASHCNQKLIGAQYFAAGRLASELPLPDYEYLSPRDWGGHGTHTSSTAGGNADVPIPIARLARNGEFTPATVSGIAPRARISAYKACFDDGAGQGTCFNSDSVAAIDQAVIDGVDIINFSIGGSTTSFLSADSVAFFNAAESGVFIAAPAGNTGPTGGTVNHGAPWITTVAAATHPRTATTKVTLGNGMVYTGASLAAAAPTLPIVLASASGLPNADNPETPEINELALCFPGTLDPAKVAGKMVLCDRGTNPRVEKSFAVQQAGGLAMILANVTAGTLDADVHIVPTIHVSHLDGPAIKAYVTGTGASATGRIAEATISLTGPSPTIAGFSARGPLLAGGGDLLKPDVSAPGVNVIAGVAPPGNFNASFAALQGTSMAAPHVAGLAALLKQLHPDWSPMTIKSALMTSATQLFGADPFAQGAGFVNPARAADPGLVYESTAADWLAFLCGAGQLVVATCEAAGVAPIHPTNLNVPSIAISTLFDNVPFTVTRTVTNVGGVATQYGATLTLPFGFVGSVNPTTLLLGAGESKSFTVTITRTAALFNSYALGSLTWTDSLHTVRIPVVARPVQIITTSAVTGSGASGSLTFNALMGYTGPYAVRPHGLVADTTTKGTVEDDPSDSFSPTGAGCPAPQAPPPCVVAHSIAVPAGTRVLRFALFDDFTDGEDDLDLYVFQGSALIGASAGPTSNEQITLRRDNGFGGTLTVYVHGFETDGPDANYTLFHWFVGPTAFGNLTATAPPTASPGTINQVTVTWGAPTALLPGRKYLGSITHHRSDAPASYNTALMAVTTVFIDVPPPPPITPEP
jgi:subtilisin family serine protease